MKLRNYEIIKIQFYLLVLIIIIMKIGIIKIQFYVLILIIIIIQIIWN